MLALRIHRQAVLAIALGIVPLLAPSIASAVPMDSVDLAARWEQAGRRERRGLAAEVQERARAQGAGVVATLIDALAGDPATRRLRQALEACRRHGIEHPLRLPPDALVRFIETRETRAARHPRKALVVMPKHDPNGAYFATDDNIATLDTRGRYDVWYAEAGSREELAAALRGGWAEPFDLIVIAGHGSARSIRFGPKGAPGARFTLADADWLADLPGIAGRLRPVSGRIVLRACSTGQSFGGARAQPFQPEDLDRAAFERERQQDRPIDRAVAGQLDPSAREAELAAALNELREGNLLEGLAQGPDLPPDVAPLIRKLEESERRQLPRRRRDRLALNRALLEAAYPETTRAGRRALAEALRRVFPRAAPGGILAGRRPTANPQFVYRDGQLTEVRYRARDGRFLPDEYTLRT